MDLPYSQQQQARRKIRSASNLQHLSLAPLTTRLPLRDDFDGTDIIDSHAYFTAASSAHPVTGQGSSPLRHVPSYIQGRSAPTTPRLLSKSPPATAPSSRSHSHESRRRLAAARAANTVPATKGRANVIPKSRSTTHLLAAKNVANASAGSAATHHANVNASAHAGGTTFPQQHHRRRKSAMHLHDHSSDDWMFRAAAIVASETRESKGQSWLTARASSISLLGMRDAGEAEDAVAFECELAREREVLERVTGNSRYASRRGSVDQDHLLSPSLFRTAAASGSSHPGSRRGSRTHSRTHSRVGSRMQLMTPLERRSFEHNGEPWSATGYFDGSELAEDDEDREDASRRASVRATGSMTPTGPDFVNLDEKLEAIELYQRDTSLEDEDHVRRLVKREKAGGVMGSWLGSVLGWSLFSVQDNEGDGDTEDEVDDVEDSEDDVHEDGEDDDEDDEDQSEDDQTSVSEEHGVIDDNGNGIEAGAGASGGPGGKMTANKRRTRQRRRAAVGWNSRGPAWSSRRRFEGDRSVIDDRIPPPPPVDQGTWRDAAWLLSVASKVIL